MIKFASGKQVIAPQAKEFLQQHRVSMFELVHRHYSADWGSAASEYGEVLAYNLEQGVGPLLSLFIVDSQTVFVSTCADRSVTMIYLPSELDLLIGYAEGDALEELGPFAVTITKSAEPIV